VPDIFSYNGNNHKTRAPKKVTSSRAATAASKTLSDGRSSKSSKSAAGSALAQRERKSKNKAEAARYKNP